MTLPNKEPIIRDLNEHVSFWRDTKRYFFCWQGDEILLNALNDSDAITEGDNLLKELSQG